MRLSANQASPHFDALKAANCKVFVNGELHKDIVEADEDAGWADKWVRDRFGNLIETPDGYETRRLLGRVEIRIDQAALL